MILVFTGNGKGKTSAALGVAFRALGYSKKVFIIQFMKAWRTGEVRFAEALNKKGFGIKLYTFGCSEFLKISKSKKVEEKIRKMKIRVKDVDEEDVRNAHAALELAKKLLEEKPFLLVLDEVNVAVKFHLLPVEEVLSFIRSVPKNVNVILTGRYAHRKIIKEADLVTNMKEVKHPFQKGIQAVKGIDF